MRDKLHYSFLVKGNPKGKGRPRFSRGHAYTPQATKDYEREIAIAYKSIHGTKAKPDEVVAIMIAAFYPVPSKARKAERAEMLSDNILPMSKPDIDNVIKVMLDGLNGIAYEDDKQVVWVKAEKHYSSDPRVHVQVLIGAGK